MKFDVLDRWFGKIQFTAEIDCADDAPYSIKVGLAVRWAIKNNADLSSADLRSANLSSADLSDVAGVIDGGTTVRGYRMIVVRHDNDVVVVSGCRALGSIEAKAHWSLGDRYVREHGYSVARRMKLRVRCLITEARAEGWIVAAPLEDSDYAFQSATNE